LAQAVRRVWNSCTAAFLHKAGLKALTTKMATQQELDFKGQHSEAAGLIELVKSESMDLNNDPRYFHGNVIVKRLSAFKTLSVVATLMLNLAVGQMFALSKDKEDVTLIQYFGFCSMTLVFLICLFTVIVILQQMFQVYRLLTVGSNGFEIAKSFYLNPNIVLLRHMSVRGFFFSLPLFMASTGCMIYVSFGPKRAHLSLPICIILICVSLMLWCVNIKHRSIFKERYLIAKSWESPLTEHMSDLGKSTRGDFATDV